MIVRTFHFACVWCGWSSDVLLIGYVYTHLFLPALQLFLHRYPEQRKEWKIILQMDPTHLSKWEYFMGKKKINTIQCQIMSYYRLLRKPYIHLHLWQHPYSRTQPYQLHWHQISSIGFLFISPFAILPPSLRCQAWAWWKKNRKKKKKKEWEKEGDRISIPHWITGVESKTTECAGTGQRGWIQ